MLFHMWWWLIPLMFFLAARGGRRRYYRDRGRDRGRGSEPVAELQRTVESQRELYRAARGEARSGRGRTGVCRAAAERARERRASMMHWLPADRWVRRELACHAGCTAGSKNSSST